MDLKVCDAVIVNNNRSKQKHKLYHAIIIFKMDDNQYQVTFAD